MSASMNPRSAQPTVADRRRQDQTLGLLDLLREIHAGELRDDDALRRVLSGLVRLLGGKAAWIRLGSPPDARVAMLMDGDGHGGGPAAFEPLAVERRAVRERRIARARDDGEGPVAAGVFRCAAILAEDEVVGVVAIADAADGDPDDTALGAVARQLGRAARNRTLRVELAAEALDLRRCFTVSSQLTAVTLRHEGSSAIATMLGELLAAPVEIHPTSPDLTPELDAAPGTIVPVGGERPGYRMAVVSGSHELGTIRVHDARPLTHADRHAIGHAAIVAAPVLLHETAAREARWRVQGGLLEELVGSRPPLDASATSRAADIGVDPDTVAPIMVLQPEGAQSVEPDRLLVAVRARSAFLAGRTVGGILAFERSGCVVVSVGHAVHDTGHARFVQALHEGLGESGLTVTAGVSRPALHAADAADEAIACLLIARARGDLGTVLSANDLGPVGVLLGSDQLERTADHVRDVLGAVRAADDSSRVPLLNTLIAFVESGGDRRAVAAREYLHRSTLKYRLARIEEVVDGRLEAPDHALRFRTAVQMLRILEARGLDPLDRRRPA
jgi:hypothetical protein